MRKIPQKIYSFYSGFSFKDKTYVSLRWKLCPFEKIESYLPKSGLILDLGCGYGLLANFLILKFDKRRVIGIDDSKTRLNIAKKTIRGRKNIEFIKKNICNFNLPVCQGAVISDFLHHLPEKVSAELLKKIYRSLDKKGRFILQEVDRKPCWKYLTTLTIDRILNPGQKLNYQPAKYWQKLLKEVGFNVKIIPAHKGLPLADVIFICKKL